MAKFKGIPLEENGGSFGGIPLDEDGQDEKGKPGVGSDLLTKANIGATVDIPEQVIGVNEWVSSGRAPLGFLGPVAGMARAITPDVLLAARDRATQAALDKLHERSQNLNAELSPEQQAADKKQYFTDEMSWKNLSKDGVAAVPGKVADLIANNGAFGPGWTDWRKVSGSAAESAPGTLATMGPTAIAARAVGKKAAQEVLAKTGDAALAQQAGIKAAEKTAAFVGGASEGAQGAGSGYEQTKRKVMELPIEDLRKSEYFQQAVKANGGDETAARIASAEAAASDSAAGAFVFDSIFGALGDRYLGTAAAGGGRRIGSVARGVAQETPTEFIQSGGEQVSENLGIKRYANQNQDPMADVGEQAVGGALSGGLMGGLMGGAFHSNSGQRTAAPGGPGGDVAATDILGSPTEGATAAPIPAAAVPTPEENKALYTPKSLTALDRVAEIDSELSGMVDKDGNVQGSQVDKAAELQGERARITASWPKAQAGGQTSFTTETGARLDGQYALMEAGDLTTSHDENLRPVPAYPAELQPRERERHASEMQIQGIVGKLDPARLGESADVATGAPIVGADGLVESGNARTIALKRVYQANGQKAETYKAFIKDNAARFGIAPEQVDAMQKPVLVRVRQTPVNRAEFARQANQATVARMSPSEQAKSDAAQIDSLEDLNPDEQGDFMSGSSRPFVRRFMARLPATEQAGLIDAAGQLSQAGYSRIRNAVLAKAYGDSPVLTRMVESLDDNLRNVGKALMRVAPAVAKAREAIGAGALFDADITPDLMAAVEELSDLKEKGVSVEEYLAQAGMFGDKLTPEARALLQFLADNLRRPGRIAEFVQNYIEALQAAGNPNQGTLLGEATAPAKGELMAAANRGQDGTTEDTGRGYPGENQAPAQDGQRQSEDAARGGGSTQGNEARGEWVAFPPETGTLGIPRADMPQIKGEHRGALTQFLEGKGVSHESEEVPANSLRPTQAEFSREKVAKWNGAPSSAARSVLASSDGYILDGHHQWIAALAANEPVNIVRFNAPILPLLELVDQFPSVGRSDGGVIAARRAENRQEFKAAMGDLADILTPYTRAAMLPEDTPNLMPTLVRLFDAGIREIGYSLKDLIAYVKKALRNEPAFKKNWNKISDATLRKAAQQAIDKSHSTLANGDLFGAIEKAQGDLFTQPQGDSHGLQEARQAPTQEVKDGAAMINGRPYDLKRDNYQPQDESAFVGADVLDRSRKLIDSFFAGKVAPAAEISDEDRTRAVDILTPLLKLAEEAKVEYDQKIIDIAKRTGAVSQMLAKVKGIDRAAEKLVLDNNFDHKKMRDLLRSTIVVNSYEDAKSVLEEIGKEFTIQRVKNKTDMALEAPGLVTEKSPDGYMDVLVNVVTPNGTIAEIQINVPSMMAAKMGSGHKLYEISRSAKEGAPEKADADLLQQEIYAAALADAKNLDSGILDQRKGHQVVGLNDPDFSSSTNRLPSGYSTYDSSTPSSSVKSIPNTQPSGNLSGTFIAHTSTQNIARMGNEGYTGSAESAGENDGQSHGNNSSPSPQGQGAEPARRTPRQRKPQQLREGSGGGDLFADDNAGASDRREAGILENRGSDGAGQDNERRPAAGKGTGARRATGVPAGRDIPAKSGQNYRFSDGDLTYEGGWLKKATQNVEAVDLAKKLETEGRQATLEEQAALAKFIGWGASEIRNKIFTPRPWELDQSWKALRERVRGILTADEWTTAERSTQYAHYTSKAVVQSMWRAVERMGFNGGAVLEPGAGIGVFPGLMDSAMATNSVYTGIEYDALTGGILKQLFPDERILVESFVDSALPDNFYDLAIGNPPFANTKILSDPAYKKYSFSLHDYFFAKSLDKVKPGGLMVYVTSRYTMDKQGDKARKYMAERADLVGAIRLPQTAFMKNAGTEVVTDVIFLRKNGGDAFVGQPWTGVQEINTDKGPAMINEYFAAHPEMVLGTHSLARSMYSKNEYTVLPKEGDIEAQFAAAVENLPAGIYRATGAAAEAAKVREIDFNPKAQKEGNYYLSDAGVLMQREGGVGVRADEGKPPKNVEIIKDFVKLRDALKQAHYDQLNNGDWEASLKALQKAYKAFVNKNGNILQNKAFERAVKRVDEDTGEEVEDVAVWRRFDLLNKINDDPDYTLVEALEKLNEETGEITESAFLHERVLEKQSAPRIETPHDALLSVLNDTGKVDMAEIGARLGIDPGDVVAALGTAIYESPSEGWQMADAYLSGNVKKKLKEAKEAAKADKRYERNVEALLSVQPVPVPPSEITPSIGMNWIPAAVYEQFLKEKAGVTAKVSYNERTGAWNVTASSGYYTAAAQQDWGTMERNAADILDHALTGRPIRITRTEGSGDAKKSVFDAAATEAANQKLAKMREAFAEWLWQDADRADKLVQLYNDTFNTIVPRTFDGRHLTLPGSTSTIKVFDHVKRGAWRIIQSGNTYLAHAVGSGKTWQMVISAMEQKRLGLINKPMMVVPNHMLQQFAREWLQLYPAARLMVADEKQFHTENRRRFVSRVAMSDLDGVIITHSAFKLLDLDPDFKKAMIEQQLDYLRAALDEVGGEDGKKSRDPKVRDIQSRIEKMEQKLEAAMSSAGKDKNVRFDQLGVDQIYVDEAHEFRKLAFTTTRQVKGIDSSGSDRAFDLWMKSRWLEEKHPGRSLVMASGTPVTNTLAELYSVQRMMAPKVLEERGLEEFDAWASMFGQENTEIEADASGKYAPVTRFTKFVNVPELTQMFREYADVLTSEHLAEMLGDKRPKVKGGSRSLLVTPETEDYKSYKEDLAARLAVSRRWKPSKDEPNNPDPIIKIIGDGRLAAIDMRFINPSLPSDPGSKLNQMIDRVIERYQRSKANEYFGKDEKAEPAKGATQMVFSDLGFGAGVAANRGFNARAWFEKRMRDAGIPMAQVAFMSDHKKSTAKLKLFQDINAGRVRILVGSSKNMGTGVNAQQRLLGLSHLDTPWFPADLEQREGRIIRQGNKNPLVEVDAFSTKGSYDTVMWQMLASKQRFIDQALSGDSSVRSIDDLSEASQFQIATAMTAGDPRAIQLAGIKGDIEKYQRLYRAHEQTRMRLRNDYDLAGAWIASAQKQLPDAEKLAAKVQDLSGDNFKAKADGKSYDKRKDWAESLLATLKDYSARAKDGKIKVGEISGFPIDFHGQIIKGMDGGIKEYKTSLRMTIGEDVYLLARDPNEDPVGMAMRVTNVITGLARKPAELRQRIEDATAKRNALEPRLDAKFEFGQVLADKIKEADDLEAAMMADQAKDDPAAEEPKLSRGTGAGMALRDLQAVADRVAKGFKNLPRVHVFESPAGLSGKDPTQKILRDYIKQAGAMDDAEGATHNGEIYLFASGMADEARAEHVLATHEVTHYGLRGAVGKDLDSALQHVLLMNAAVRKEATRLKARLGLKSNLAAVEEVLADMPNEALVELRGWRKVVHAIRNWLNKAGATALAKKLDGWITAGLDDQQKADLFVADLVRGAREWVKSGKGTATTGTMLADKTLAEDIAGQEAWLTKEAKARGYKSIDELAEKDYPVFENLAALWRKKNPVENALLSRNIRHSQMANRTVAEQADDMIAKPSATPRPLDAIMRGAVKATMLDKAMNAIYRKAGALLDRYTPEMIKAGMVADYGIPEAVLDRRAVTEGRQRQQIRGAGALLEKLATLTRAESRVAYEWMNSQDPESAEYLRQQLPEDSIKVLAEVEKMIDALSKEAVSLGQLDPEAYQRNRFAYLRRSYVKHTAELTQGEAKARGRAISILGDQYKGRGMSDAVDMAKVKNSAPEWWKRKLQDGKADNGLKGEKFVRLERRAHSGQGTQAMAGIGDRSKGRLMEVAYWPADVQIPARLSTWEHAGTWEVRDTKGDKLVVWRDFTAQEREAMGEIDEARFAIAKTLHGMIHDVEVGRYLKWLSQTYAKIDGDEVDGEIVGHGEGTDKRGQTKQSMGQVFKKGEWVQVPDSTIPGTKVKKYGDLAGKYLPGPIWNDLRQMGSRMQPLGQTYATILRAWKMSKTSLSPAVHMNNVMANFVMADWHDVTAGHVLKALRLMTSKDLVAKEVLGRYTDSGGGVGTWATRELQQEQLRPLLEELEKEIGQAAETTGQAGVYAALQLALHAKFPESWQSFKTGKVSKGAVKVGRSMIDLYEAEDQVFRLAAWLRAKEEGSSDLEAGKEARKSFLDYNINAPWVQMMRSTAFPFIAFTYRAVPMLMETAAKKPWKLMKLGLFFGMLNAIGYAMSGGDEDDERKLLPEEKAGRIWGMVPKLIRMPWNDDHDSPVFLDVRRWVPSGDVFDTGATNAAVPILPVMQTGGPLQLLAEFYSNKVSFTGREITLDTDTGVIKGLATLLRDFSAKDFGVEQESKVADWLYKSFAPNILLLPGTYAFTGAMNAGKGKTDTFGREQSLPQAVVASMGIKVGSYPKDVLQLNAQRKAQAELMEIRRNITGLNREYQRHGLTTEEYQAKVGDQMKKQQKVVDELGKKMGGG